MSGKIRIGIAGALGRMGKAVAKACQDRDEVEIAALYDRPGSEGQIAEHEGGGGRVLVTREAALETCDAIIDFTTPEATVQLVGRAVARGGPALILGVYTRYAAMAACFFLVVAVVALLRAKPKHFWLWNLAGVEYPVFWGICAALVAMNPT